MHKYDELRKARIEPMIVPLSGKLISAVLGKDAYDYSDCIPEFLAHGIIEGDIFNVC